MNVSSFKVDGVDVSKLAKHDFVLKVLLGKSPKLVFEWAAPEIALFGLSQDFSRAKVEMETSSIEVTVSDISPIRTKVQVRLLECEMPKVDIGIQKWDAKLRRRCRTKWLSLGDVDVGCEALPSGCRQILLKARNHELVLNHTLPKVQEYLSKAKLADAPAAKRPLSSYNQMQKALAEINKKARKEKMRGSDGAKCDGCGMDEGEDFDELDLAVICERSLYTACDGCAVHHCRGTCYCKKGW
eukprot:Skav202785  [mRNA]  locus=scaffold326:529527:530252:+ [translate_table: standard]